MSSSGEEYPMPRGSSDEHGDGAQTGLEDANENTRNLENFLANNPEIINANTDRPSPESPLPSKAQETAGGLSKGKVDLRNQDQLRMLLQATSTEHHIRGLLERPEHQHRSDADRQQIVDRALKQMVDFGALDPKVLEYGGKAYEGHRNAVRGYMGSLIDAVSGDLGEGKLLEAGIPNLHLDSPRRFQLQTPRMGLDLAGPDAAVFGPRWEEIKCLGKGAFGSVWACKNLLDGEIYAIKRVIITEDFLKIAQIVDIEVRERAFAELHHEVKVLAKLDHPNIVRYYASWMERMSPDEFEKIREKICPDGMDEYTGSGSGSGVIAKYNVRESDESDDEDGEDESQQDEESDEEEDGDEESEDDYDDEEEEDVSEDESSGDENMANSAESDLIMPAMRDEGGLDISDSGKDHDSAGSSLNIFQEGSRNSSGTESGMEIVPRSDTMLLPQQETHNVHILSIQMAKYSLSLNEFIKTPTDNPTSPKTLPFSYEYQPRIAVELLLRIVDGVEYMHHHHLVHRDLKPANIFLKVEYGAVGEMQGSVRVSGCKCGLRGQACPETGSCLPGPLCWVTPKIGDFGLTADIKRTLGEKRVLTKPLEAEGTFPYMPPPWAEKAIKPEGGSATTADKEAGLHSTDAYALGVILFELLYPFSTALERFMVIGGVRAVCRPETCFPADFCGRYASSLSPDILSAIKHLILRLTCHKGSRMTVSELKVELQKLLERI
ncbi:Eukaryotic translation initiation factor [Drechslerella dactyloides]|uniref:non-specific serine/threonine protein kinase n=1 Tax=Drechslerella dactyloides TaxID=74499 RepID=A0AAD6IUP0_DREDA|nr:Eukaryotic translation initiation factor [Drechslerella dactyloides]